MAKRRRRLKKSVKRGCLLSLLLLVATYAAVAWFTQHSRLHPSDVPQSPADTTWVDTSAVIELRGRIERLMRAPGNLNPQNIALCVYDFETGQTVYRRQADRLVAPASCMKLLTAIAAMEYLGLNYTFATQVTLCGEQSGDTFRGTVCFQLDDDPLMENLQPLVEALCQRGIRRIEGDIRLDLLRDDTLKAHPTAAVWDIPYNKLPILLKGRARIESDLRYLLTAQGITLVPGTTDDSQPSLLIYRHETPLTEVLTPMLIHSSNIKADALFQHMERMAARLAVPDLDQGRWLLPLVHYIGDYPAGAVVNDGSGLSPDNRLTADFLVALLKFAWKREPMRRVLIDQALATPAHPTRHGSLLGRMSAPLFRNRVFVKTGTLTSVGLSSLAGYVQLTDGRWIGFAVINTDSPVAESRIFQDELCKTFLRTDY